MGMKRPKRPTESKPGKVFKTGSSPTDSTEVDLSYSYRVLGGVGSTSQSSRVQDGGKSQHAEQSANNVFGAGSSRSLVELSQDAMGRGGRCLACKGGIRTTNLYLTCKRGSVGQSEGLSIPRSSVRFRLKTR